MKKIVLILSLVMVVSFVLAGCNTGEKAVEVVESVAEEVVEGIDALDGLESNSAPVEVDKDGNPVDGEGSTEESVLEEDSVEARIAGMIENQYAELEVSAAILKRMAILPGAAFAVEVKITNTGEKPIGFVQGSGSAVVPSALIADSKDLQYVQPVESMGAMTMDFRTDVLAAGETKTYTLNFIAAEPDLIFDQFAFDYKNETGDYIADKTSEEIKAAVPTLKEVTPGSYNIDIYFTYSLLENTEDLSPIMEETGYAKTTLIVGIG